MISPPVDCSCEMVKVVIVGGGIAGLAAARKLAKSGKPIAITLLEAQARLGGRVLTMKSKDGRLSFDLGASWFHDADENPLYEISKEKGWRTEFDDTSSATFAVNGQQISEDIFKGSDSIMKALERHFDSKKVIDMSLEKFCQTYAARHMPVGDMRAIAPQLLRLFELWTGMPWSEQSAAQLSGESEQAHSRNAFNLDGNEQVIKWLLSELPKNVEIRLRQPVSRINGHSVILKTGEEIDADFIICTIPVGHLRQNRHTLFAELPPQIDAAIEGGTMAALGKAVFQFSDTWWVDAPRYFVVDPDGGSPVFFTNAYKFLGASVLVALFAPPLTQVIEKEPHRVFDILKKYLSQLRVDPARAVPTPDFVAVTDWSLNEYFLGSYSGVRVGQDETDLILPFRNGAGSIRFAGEHTSLEGAGCMHGAFASGEREAEHILNVI